MSATPKASKALTRRKFLQTGMVTGFVLPSTVLGQPPNRARPKASQKSQKLRPFATAPDSIGSW